MIKAAFTQSVYTGPDPFGTGWYEIGTNKPCAYTGPGRSGTDRICCLVGNGSTYDDDPIWNRTFPFSNRSPSNRVVPTPNGSEHIRSLINVT